MQAGARADGRIATNRAFGGLDGKNRSGCHQRAELVGYMRGGARRSEAEGRGGGSVFTLPALTLPAPAL